MVFDSVPNNLEYDEATLLEYVSRPSVARSIWIDGLHEHILRIRVLLALLERIAHKPGNIRHGLVDGDVLIFLEHMFVLGYMNIHQKHLTLGIVLVLAPMIPSPLTGIGK